MAAGLELSIKAIAHRAVARRSRFRCLAYILISGRLAFALGLFTGQVGYSWSPAFLAYLKGGAAVVGDRYDTFTTATGLMMDHADTTRWGGTVGENLQYEVTGETGRLLGCMVFGSAAWKCRTASFSVSSC